MHLDFGGHRAAPAVSSMTLKHLPLRLLSPCAWTIQRGSRGTALTGLRPAEVSLRHDAP